MDPSTIETQSYEAEEVATSFKAEALSKGPVDLCSPDKQSDGHCEDARLHPAETVDSKEAAKDPDEADMDGGGHAQPAETKDGDGSSRKRKDEDGHAQTAETKEGDANPQCQDGDGSLAKTGESDDSEKDCSHLERCMVERMQVISG